LAEVAGLPETSKLPFCATFEDGLHNMQIIEAAIQSGMANGAASAVPAATPSYIR
jgi:hypothetical protein